MSLGLAAITIMLSFILTLALVWVGLRWFPSFVSGEKKEGVYRDDRGEQGGSGRLPGIGGPAIIIGITIVTILVASIRPLEWEEVAALIGPLWLFGAAGFVDDLSKKVRGQGLGEGAKGAGVVMASLLVAVFLYWRLGFDQPHSPYANWALFQDSVVWGVFFFLLALAVMAASSLSANMSDGLDGLTGGLAFIAAVAYVIIATVQGNPVLAVFSAGLVGASAGFLRWNWPSNWARTASVARRAKAYLGDSGALALGGALAVVALLSQTELLWFIIGGVFVLEGGSALVQTRILTRLFRAFLKLPRYADVDAFVPHTEFPLPFRATPLHHHFDLLKLPRVWTVYGFWFAGFIFALLGVVTYLVVPSWWKGVPVGLGFVWMAAIWTLGTWTKGCFLGLWPEGGQDRRLALYYGKPYQLARWKLYRMQEMSQLTEGSVKELQHTGLLWKTLSVYDAYALLGFLNYECGEYAEAISWWRRIDVPNLRVRPNIQMLLQDAVTKSQGVGL